MATLADGLGFEELGGPGDTGSKASQIWITGSIISQDRISGLSLQSATSVSGTDLNVSATGSFANVRLGDSLVGVGSVTDGDGRVRSSAIGSPGTFGAIMQAGSFLMPAGSVGSVAFKTNFAAANDYFFQAWPRSGLEILDATATGSWNVVSSGTANSGRNTSGVNLIGGGGAVLYDYLAIGEAAT